MNIVKSTKAGKRCILQTFLHDYLKCVTNPKQQETALVPNSKQAILLKAISLTSCLNFKQFVLFSFLLSLYL